MTILRKRSKLKTFQINLDQFNKNKSDKSNVHGENSRVYDGQSYYDVIAFGILKNEWVRQPKKDDK